MRRLKADFHTHAADDPRDTLRHSSEMLIDAASEEGIEVLSITCHERSVYTESLSRYAERRGILLLPGIEAMIENCHVLIINPAPEHIRARTFAELRAIGRRDAAFIAPHPFYPTPNSLMRQLKLNIDLFDAIEWCSLYMGPLNPNVLAARAARRYGLPMVGTSDTHELPYRCTTCTWIEAEPTIAGIVEAIRKGRVELETRSWSPLPAARFALYAARGIVSDLVGI
ncbi:MAG: PHP domain-containing protein [Candidatus Hydrogenedentes bacterium]|nr:PHP domain-containing protein [Candidatus Hydrogenedentota bacterium]